MGIYSILNIANNKRYVGSSRNIVNRWRVHKSRLRLNKHHSQHLQNSYNLYPNNFIFILIEAITDTSTLELREQFWVDTFKSYESEFGYNAVRTVSPIGSSRMKERWAKVGAKEEQSRRMKEVCSSPEHRLKLSLGHIEYFKNPCNRHTKLLKIPHRKRVRYIESGEIFESIAQAAKKLSVSVVKIRDSATGKRKSNGNMSFEWITDV